MIKIKDTISLLLKNIFISVLLLLNIVNISYAQEDDTDILEKIDEQINDEYVEQYIDDSLSIYRCFAKGNIDFLLFIEAVIYNDGFFNGVIEPFNDVLFRNQCHAADISTLIKKRDQVRSAIRTAFLECRNERIPELERGYNLASLEIYYVRNVVDGPIYSGLPIDYLGDDLEQYYSSSEKLYNDMYEQYVESGTFEKIEFDTVFRNLEARYAERKSNYIVCENASFSQVKNKFLEFIENWGGFKTGLEYADKKLGGRAEKIYEAFTDPGIEDFFKNIVQVNVNKNSFYDEADKFYDYLDETLYSDDFRTLTSKGLNEALSNAAFEYNKEQAYKALNARFYVLYGASSDQGIESFVNELNTTNEIILDSLDPIDGLLNCVNTMNARQCPNSI